MDARGENRIKALRDGVDRLARWAGSHPKYEIELFCVFLVPTIGLFDYLAGVEISLALVYLFPVAAAAWFVGNYFAFAMAFYSVIISRFSEIALGMKYSSEIIPLWNASIRLIFYALFVILLTQLRSFQRELGSRVQERASALTKEIAERERLERQMLQISEREQMRIGQDLHDGLCQHLTGVALAAQVLTDKLKSLEFSEAEDAHKIVNLVEEAITLARGTAKGLHPVESQASGLMQALDEFTITTSDLFKVSCKFECDSPVFIHSPTTATHLYRIAQEGVSNAIKHGQATQIIIELSLVDGGTKLSIFDNCPGIPVPPTHLKGMGLRIMADRAKMIGAVFGVGRSSSGGTELICVVPDEAVVTAMSDA